MRTLIVEFQPLIVDGEYHSGSPRRHYSYAYVGQKAVKRGDWALVHNGSNFGIVEVKRVIPGIDAKVTKHVIEVLTREEFETYREHNNRIEDLRSLKDELDHRLAQDKELDRYRDLASRDPRSAEILKELEGFFGINPNRLEVTPAVT